MRNAARRTQGSGSGRIRIYGGRGLSRDPRRPECLSRRLGREEDLTELTTSLLNISYYFIAYYSSGKYRA